MSKRLKIEFKAFGIKVVIVIEIV